MGEKEALIEEKTTLEAETTIKCRWYVEKTASIMADCFVEVHGEEFYGGDAVSNAFLKNFSDLNDEGFRLARSNGYPEQNISEDQQ